MKHSRLVYNDICISRSIVPIQNETVKHQHAAMTFDSIIGWTKMDKNEQKWKKKNMQKRPVIEKIKVLKQFEIIGGTAMKKK